MNNKKVVSSNFVQSMLQSAQENKEAKPQTRYDGVNPADIAKIMEDIKKGKVRR